MLFISPPFGNYLTFLPYTMPIKGSFTIKPRDGLLTQIMQTLHYSTLYKGWINKIGLKNAGSFGGTLSVIDFFGTINFVCPSIISSKESFVICNDCSNSFSCIMV